MLPGFRFLFAAILLSTSILIFGVGAAALLRATHEEFVANPSWRNQPQEQVFAQAAEPAETMLATLRVEPVAPEPAPSIRDQIPTVGLPPADADQNADVTPDEPAQRDAATVEAPAAAPIQEAALLAADSPAPAAAITTPATEDEVAATSIAAAASAPASEPPQADTTVPAAVEPDTGDIKSADLGDPTAASEIPVPKARPASPEPDKATKRRAQPLKRRHRIVRRPPPPPVQQTFDPFAIQQQPALTAATRSR